MIFHTTCKVSFANVELFQITTPRYSIMGIFISQCTAYIPQNLGFWTSFFLPLTANEVILHSNLKFGSLSYRIRKRCKPSKVLKPKLQRSQQCCCFSRCDSFLPLNYLTEERLRKEYTRKPHGFT
jgi:hypothetical protein